MTRRLTNAPAAHAALDIPACVADATWTLREFRAAARAAAGLDSRDHRPVVVVAGDAAPRVEGSGWCYRTPAGDRVRHPNAYRRAYGHPVYWPSTREVVVGAEWRPTAS